MAGTFNNLGQGASFALGSATAYIYYDADLSTFSLTGGNDVVISFVPVPEPATVLVAAAGGLGLLRLVRRRRRAHSAA